MYNVHAMAIQSYNERVFVYMPVKLGLQLYSLRHEMAVNPLGTIRKVLEIGYRYLEPANGNAEKDPLLGCGVTVDALTEVLRPYSGHVSSSHVGPLTLQTLPEIVKTHKAAGNYNIVEAIMFYTGYDHLMRRCEEYNKIGKYLVENGMNPLLYHNHYHEYQLFNGKEVLYHLSENTDERYLQFQLDTGWVKRAGRDPLAEMDHFGNRVRLIHIKDFARKPPNLLIGKDAPISWETFGANHQPGDAMKPADFVEAGSGVMDLQAIIDKANTLGVAYAVLEQDDTSRDIFDSVRISYEQLRLLRGLATE